jgi:hypothetical protein
MNAEEVGLVNGKDFRWHDKIFQRNDPVQIGFKEDFVISLLSNVTV